MRQRASVVVKSHNRMGRRDAQLASPVGKPTKSPVSLVMREGMPRCLVPTPGGACPDEAWRILRLAHAVPPPPVMMTIRVWSRVDGGAFQPTRLRLFFGRPRPGPPNSRGTASPEILKAVSTIVVRKGENLRPALAAARACVRRGGTHAGRSTPGHADAAAGACPRACIRGPAHVAAATSAGRTRCSAIAWRPACS